MISIETTIEPWTLPVYELANWEGHSQWVRQQTNKKKHNMIEPAINECSSSTFKKCHSSIRTSLTKAKVSLLLFYFSILCNDIGNTHIQHWNRNIGFALPLTFMIWKRLCYSMAIPIFFFLLQYCCMFGNEIDTEMVAVESGGTEWHTIVWHTSL